MQPVGRWRWTRRQLVLTAGGFGLLAGCGRLAFQAQAPPTKLHRIGFLVPGFPSGTAPNLAAFQQGLREHGYTEGENIILESRYAEERYDRLPEFAAELVGLPVEVIVTQGTPVALAARQVTTTAPIVMATSGDPVESGLVASLARPGGNITGLTLISPELSAKRLQLLKDAVTGISRVAAVWNPANAATALSLREMEVVAGSLAVQLHPVEVRGPDEFESAFDAIIGEGADALTTMSDSLFFNHHARLAELAAKNRLPSVFPEREFANAGGLLTYGASGTGNFRRAAYYVDRILKGASPADLPVERPTKFDLVINLRTAQALGLTIPPHVLLQATEIIQ
jgi:putative tryptophan/tyrosine transport system substrate-binding protein